MAHTRGIADDERVALLALMLTPGLGATTARHALAMAGRAGLRLGELLRLPARERAALAAPGDHRTPHHLNQCGAEHHARAAELTARVDRLGGRAFIAGDAGYPEAMLRDLGPAAPPLVFALGDNGLLERPSAAVVGVRTPSPEGAALAASCAAVFAREGIVVVSGGAQGVDTAAHRAALDAGGATVVVLPQGLLTYSPPPEIAQALRDGRAALLSRCAPDTPWETYAAVERNAVIAALARLVCVVEPGRAGGSVRTARCALERGKPVLVAGNPHRPGFAEALVRAGARPLRPETLPKAWENAGKVLGEQGLLA